MQQLGRFRIFAGHYQFILCDAEADPLDHAPHWNDAAHGRGYVAGDSVARIASRATLNNIVVEVELADRPPFEDDSERRFAFPLNVPSGKLWVTSLDGLDDPNVLRLPPGRYTCYVLSYNLGVDEVSTGELLKLGDDRRLSDRERFARTDYERHRVVLVSPVGAGCDQSVGG